MNNNKQRKKVASSTRTRSFETRIDLEKDTRDQMVDALNQALADLFDLYSQTKHAHWNVKGKDFYQLHELFDEMAEELVGSIDRVAERATTLGGEAHGTVRMAAAASQVEEYPAGNFESMEVAAALAARYADTSARIRERIDEAEKAEDMVTSDLFIDVCSGLDKSLWFLEAHLQG